MHSLCVCGVERLEGGGNRVSSVEAATVILCGSENDLLHFARIQAKGVSFSNNSGPAEHSSQGVMGEHSGGGE